MAGNLACANSSNYCKLSSMIRSFQLEFKVGKLSTDMADNYKVGIMLNPPNIIYRINCIINVHELYIFSGHGLVHV